MEWQLTLADYKNMGYDGFISDSEDAFNSVERKAHRAVDAITSYYYEDNDLAAETWPQRANAYKQAIAEQIDFVQATGIDASYSTGDNFKSVSIGRLSLTPDGDAKTDGMINGVCKEAYALLAHYGLLYRGRGSAEYAATHF